MYSTLLEDGRSLVYKLLTSVTNGDKIVLEKLDACVSTTHDDPDNKDYGAAIDYRYLVEDDVRNILILKDILELPRSATTDIMDHPVITTFISRRWPMKMFAGMGLVYVFFVLSFTAYLLFNFTKYHDEENPLRFLGRVCSDEVMDEYSTKIRKKQKIVLKKEKYELFSTLLRLKKPYFLIYN